jgi:hypothetical protein
MAQEPKDETLLSCVMRYEHNFTNFGDHGVCDFFPELGYCMDKQALSSLLSDVLLLLYKTPASK